MLSRLAVGFVEKEVDFQHCYLLVVLKVQRLMHQLSCSFEGELVQPEGPAGALL